MFQILLSATKGDPKLPYFESDDVVKPAMPRKIQDWNLRMMTFWMDDDVENSHHLPSPILLWGVYNCR